MTCNNFRLFIKTGSNFDSVFKSCDFKWHNALPRSGPEAELCPMTYCSNDQTAGN